MKFQREVTTAKHGIYRRIEADFGIVEVCDWIRDGVILCGNCEAIAHGRTCNGEALCESCAKHFGSELNKYSLHDYVEWKGA